MSSSLFTFRDRVAVVLLMGSGFAVGGATLLGWAQNVSHHHPVNHAVEAPLIVGGILMLLFGIVGIVLVALAAAAWADAR